MLQPPEQVGKSWTSADNIWDSIKRNPIKSAIVGAVILFTLPYSAIAAAVVLAGKIVKDVIDPPPVQSTQRQQSQQQQPNQQQQIPQPQISSQQQQSSQRMRKILGGKGGAAQLIKNIATPHLPAKKNNKNQER